MGEFTASEVEAKGSCSIGTVRSRIRELSAAGKIIQTQEARGQSPAKFMVAENAPTLDSLILPELKFEENKNSFIDTAQTIVDKV